MPERIFGLAPFIYPEARVLILGSMPSEASLKQGFYYGHKQNRLWKIVSALVDRELNSIEEKKAAARELHLAFFDVIKSCVREGSMDSAIMEPEPEDIAALTALYQGIERIILNGGLSKKLFFKFNDLSKIKAEVFSLPSTSPANAQYSLAKLTALYSPIIKCQNS